MNEREIMKREDLPLYTHLAVLWGLICESYNDLQSFGYTDTGSAGQVSQSAPFRVYMKASSEFNDLCARLGVGPYGRMRLNVEDRQQAAKQQKLDIDLN